MKEIWKNIKGYENLYQVSNLGNIKSLYKKRKNGNGDYFQNEKMLKQSLTTTGYKKVELSINGSKKSFKIHRLVACAFIGEPPYGKEIVNHKDGNPINNNVNNLEWCDQSYNVRHAIENNLIQSFKISEQRLRFEHFINNLSCGEIANKYNTTKAIIHNNFQKYKIKAKGGPRSKYNLTVEFLIENLKNKNQHQLAKELGCDQSLISHTLKKYKRMGLL